MEENLIKVFSKNLINYLDSYEMSQAQLSKSVGASQATVSNWCNGTQMPRPEKIDLICRVFHCTRSDLLGDNSDKEYRESEVERLFNKISPADQKAILSLLQTLASRS